jgi:cell division protein FtsZ
MEKELANKRASTPLKQKIGIKVLGIGGAGCNAVDHLAAQALPGVSYALLNTDAAALGRLSSATRLVLGNKLTRGLGVGGDPERGRMAAEEDEARLQELCQGAEVVFVVAGLGGGTGTGGAPVLARVAKEAGALVLGIVFLPFDFEGHRRARQAQIGLSALKGVADGVICLPNQKLFKLVDENTSLIEAFAITNDLVADGVRGIWRLLAQPGMINVDFADLCSVAQGRHAESILATAEARGEHRAREVVDRLLAHPLIAGGVALAEASGLLVAIAGGPDLTTVEVSRIMEQLNRHAEQASIIMGAAVSEDLAEQLTVTLVASCKAPGNAAPVEKEEAPELAKQLVEPTPAPRPPSRFVAPPPEVAPEQLLQAQGRSRKASSRLRQGQLPLEIVSKGRFEKSEPTIHHGQDLDVPTYIRRGVALN